MQQIIKPLVLNVQLPNSQHQGWSGDEELHSGTATAGAGGAEFGARVAGCPGMGLQRDASILVN